MTEKSTPNASPAQQAGGGGGNGSDRELHGRVSAIEAQLQHLATKEDIQSVKTLIAERESKMFRWLIGILAAASISTIVALISLVVALLESPLKG